MMDSFPREWAAVPHGVPFTLGRSLKAIQALILAFLAFFASCPAQASEGPATLAGVVRDADSDLPIVGVTITVLELERAVLTDGDGRYRIESVPPGPHHLSFRRAGYRHHSLHALVPRTGVLEINVR